MRALSRRTLQQIATALECCPDLHGARLAREVRLLLAKESHRLSLNAKRVAPRTKARHDKTAAVRRACVARAGGRCENCMELFLNWAPEMDHFFGGSKKRSHESVDRCWMLCQPCHRAKTNNDPSRDYWLAAFLRHRRRHGLRAVGL